MRMVVLGSAVASASAIGFHNTTTTATPHVVYTTEVVTALTTYCPAPTTITHGTKTYTVTSATTLTITDCPCTISKPVHPTGTPADDCAKKCYDAYNVCRSKPGANFSYCGSEFAGCLGYNPFAGTNGTLATPTACSSKPTSAVVTTPGPTSTQVQPPHDCAAECSAAYNKCRGKAGANMSTCASEYASCLGYNPFGADGSLIAPTACSSKPVATGTATPTTPVVVPTQSQPAGGKDCAEKCYDAYNQCRTKSGANMSLCASDFAGCLGYNPFDGNGSLVTPTACSAGATATGTTPTGNPTGNPTNPPVVTAGAGTMTPAKVLLALGAIALL
jgi:hypothetical protein